MTSDPRTRVAKLRNYTIPLAETFQIIYKSLPSLSLLNTSITSTPIMLKQPDFIPLHPLFLAPSSKWSLELDDLEQAVKSHIPKPPSHAWFHPMCHKATTCHPYIIDAPILHPNSSIGYAFEFWAGPSTTNAAGERVCIANFQKYLAILRAFQGISCMLGPIDIATLVGSFRLQV